MNSSHKTLSAIVLAAGESKRMKNRNKLLLPFRNKTMVRNVVESILASGVGEIIIVLGHEAEAVRNELHDLPVDFVLNKNFAQGMTTSIQEGVNRATGNGYMICLSDMIQITSAEYATMKDEFLHQIDLDEQCICIPRFKGEKGNPVIFSSYYRESILEHEEMEGCKTIVQQNKEHIHWMEMSTAHVLQDMDLPEDYMSLKMDDES